VSPSDEELLGQIDRGDTEAFDELYRRYSRRLLHYLYRMLGEDEDRAQDFLQEVFLKVVEGGTSLGPGRRFAPWVFSVAHNLCCNEYRRLQVRREASAEVTAFLSRSLDVYDAPGEEMDRRAFAESLHRQLALLDETRRSTFLLRYQEGLSLREIGAVMGCPPGTVKSRLFYTLRHLAAALAEHAPCGSEDT
jgi:RNA polymerase sigma-70 factor (ECF subfamily)